MKTTVHLLVFWFATVASVAIPAAQQTPLPPPPLTLARPVTETLHGVKLTDPYRWLEDQDSTATRQWLTSQVAYTRAALDRIPARQALSERLTALMRVDTMSAPDRRGGRYFFTRRLAGQDQHVICLRQGRNGADEVLIDPHPLSKDHTASVDLLDISEDGRLLVYGLRQGGQDEIAVRLFDVDHRAEVPCPLPKGRYNGVSLTADKTGLFYARRSPDEGGRVYYSPLAGDRATTETYLFGKDYGTKQYVTAGLSEDHRHLLIQVSHGWGKRTDIFVKDATPEGPIRPLIEGIDAEFNGEILGETLFVSTNDKAPNRRLLAIDLANPAPAAWRELIPERKDSVIEGFSLAAGRLFLNISRNVISKIEIYSLPSDLHTFSSSHLSPSGEISFSDLGSVSGVSGRWKDEEVYFSFSSFHIPSTLYEYNAARAERSVWFRPAVPFDSAPYETRQVWFASKDGTRIPMFIVARKGLKLDGSNPTILYGYGGFNAAMQPRYSSMAAAWIERGGVYAVANLRGGSEFGEEWHRAGMLDKKQNVFDDFIAAAGWLIEQKYTSPARLAISGGSNGGLLVGAALTQRPELFRAVVCGFPLLDMVRFHKFMLGPLWVPEYGSAEDPAQFKTLLAYSPYQHVRAGTRYPAVMLVSGDSDTRVAPLHARKMAALLQAQATPERPVLLRYELSAGHSAGQPISKSVDVTADELSFLMWQLE